MKPHVRHFINARIFTGHEFMAQTALTTINGVIQPFANAGLEPGGEIVDVKNGILTAAFIDLQKYGGGGILFSQYPGVAALEALVAENRLGGVGQCMVTIATQPLEVAYACMDAIRAYWKAGGEGILGLHLEGPFINATKRGAHRQDWVIEPTVDMVQTLLDYGDGVLKIVTLAPECCEPRILHLFAAAGVVVSAGHSNATYEQAVHFFDDGVTAVTHLFNAMSALHHRDTGLPGAAMLHNGLTASVIADGLHVSFEALQIAKRVMGERLFYITDAVTPTSEGPYQHEWRANSYSMPDGTLSGSAISMLQAVKNGVYFCNIDLMESLRMAGLYPARLVGIDEAYGVISAGKAPGLLCIDEHWNCRLY
jgi:N-acetylglucosamine-6-phosphate deacetylase